MFVVYFYENKNLLLTQFLKEVPAVGEDLRIKGRKGKVSRVNSLDDRTIHVQLDIEPVNKKQLIVDNSKKKKGK